MDEAALTASVVTAVTRTATPVAEATRQEALDAAALLQVRRSRLAGRLRAGEDVEAEVVGTGMQGVNEWMHRESMTWRSVRSTRPRAPLAYLRATLPVNRARAREGVSVTTLLDFGGTSAEARLLVANELTCRYLQGVAPVQMTIVDGAFVLLHGPEVEGQPTLMKVSAPSAVEAAEHYWAAALATVIPFRSTPRLSPLSPRQRQIAALLGSGLGDEGVAATLAVSVRTVRGDIAGILETLGVRSRFEAGARLSIWNELVEDEQGQP